MIRRPKAAELAPPLFHDEFVSLFRDVQFLPEGRSIAPGESRWISEAQEVCLVNFEKIVDGEEFLLSANRCFRYLLFADDKGENVLAAIDILSGNDERRIRRTRVGALVGRTVETLQTAASFSEERGVDYVARFVEVAAMQLDAIWLVELKGEQEKLANSFVIPAANGVGFKKLFPYTARRFNKKLTAAAQRQRRQRLVSSQSLRSRPHF
jgi:hypothetical protein